MEKERNEMKEIALSQQGKNKGKFVALVDDEDYDRLNQFRWFVNDKGNCLYVRRRAKDKTEMPKFLLDPQEGMVINHIDGNGLNNQKSNLRICTRAECCRRRSKSANKSSIYKGVSWHKINKRWISQICIDGKYKHLGYFSTQLRAAKAYDRAAKKYHKEFANLNFK